MISVAGMDMGAFVDALGSAVLHFLWQGTLLGLLLVLVLAGLRRSTPSARYAACVGAMSVGVVLFAGTLLVFATGVPGSDPLTIGHSEGSAMFTMSPGPGAWVQSSRASGLELWIGWLWFAGATLLVMRLVLQWMLGQGLRQTGVTAPAAVLRADFDVLARAVGVRGGARMLVSARIRTPMVAERNDGVANAFIDCSARLNYGVRERRKHAVD